MKRFVYPIFEKCEPLPTATEISSGKYKLEIDLKHAFHQGYIDVHGEPPKGNNNPFLHEYEQLLTKSSDLRFRRLDIGSDSENKVRESGKLGRCLARGILSEHLNYVWFASIQNLSEDTSLGWSIKPTKGDRPDWLVGNNTECAVAEAKGTHQNINVSSKKCDDWRKQVQNISVLFNGKAQSLKTWILATRFVTEAQPRTLPQILLEDPLLPGEDLNSNSTPELLRWISQSHIIKNLERIGQYRLSLRARGAFIEKEKVKVLVWQCLHPDLMQFRFIGKPIDFKHFYTLPYHWLDLILSPEASKNFIKRLSVWYSNFGASGFFDGMEIDPIRAIISDRLPETLSTKFRREQEYEYISFLRDGSLIAPMDLMRPVDIKEF